MRAGLEAGPVDARSPDDRSNELQARTSTDMGFWTPLVTVLAQQQQPGPGAAFGSFLLPLIAIMFLWYFIILRPQRREQVKREEMLKSLKKNDRVVTIGGIIGTIANISPDGKEVTLKVDDNTRIRFLRSSIQGVLNDETKGEN